jgi:hypothetical protein
LKQSFLANRPLRYPIQFGQACLRVMHIDVGA